MTRTRRSIAVFVLSAAVLLAVSASAAEITGRVRNATTNQPAAGVSVNLIALRQGMVPVRETVTDRQGRYRFVVESNPNEQFLVQVPFQGVNYNQPAAATAGGSVTADVTIYEAGASPDDITITEHIIFFEPRSNHVQILELFSITNSSNPPRSYAPEDGSFTFAVPDTVGDLQALVSTPTGMPLKRQPQPAGEKNNYTLSYPLRPADTQIRISYVVPLSGSHLELRLPRAAPADTRFVVIPSAGVKLSGAGLEEIPQTRSPDRSIFAVREPAADALALSMEIDAEVVARAAAQLTTAQPAAPQRDNPVTIIAHPINQVQFYIVGLGLFVLLFGLYYLYSLEPSPGNSETKPAAENDSTRQRGHVQAD